MALKPENKMKKKEKSFFKLTMILMIKWHNSNLNTKIAQHMRNIRFNSRNTAIFRIKF